jgi:site-specific DNA recombinase
MRSHPKPLPVSSWSFEFTHMFYRRRQTVSALKSLLEKSLASSNQRESQKSENRQRQANSGTNFLEENQKTSSSELARNAVYRLGAYIRLSPSDEIRDEGSLISHPQRIESFVTFKNVQHPGWGAIVEFYIDKDLSGGDMKRPELLRMLQDVKLGRINSVIATELSRFSRDVHDFMDIWKFLKAHKAPFFSLKENYDTSTPMGEHMVIQAISIAQLERKSIVQRIRDGSRARAERGLSNGGQRMMGYDPDPYKRCHLAVNEPEAAIVRQIFEKALELRTVTKVRNYLNESGSRTKSYITKQGVQRGGTLWPESTLMHLLTNLAYIGYREINKNNRGAKEETLKESERYQVVKASWPAILDEKVFWGVQEIIESNRRFARRYDHIYRLTGMIECGSCGKTLVGMSATGRSGKYFYYGHGRRFTSRGGVPRDRCYFERIPALPLEEAVVDRLTEVSRDKRLVTDLLSHQQTGKVDRREQLDEIIAKKEQERRTVQVRIDNLLLSLAERPEGLNLKTIYAKIAEYETQRTQVEASIEQFKGERSSKGTTVVNADGVFKLFRTFKDYFPKCSPQEQRDILRSVVFKLVIRQDHVGFYYYTSPEEEVLGVEGLDARLVAGAAPKNGAAVQPLETTRTAVRPRINLVDPNGFEPLTYSMPWNRSTN